MNESFASKGEYATSVSTMEEPMMRLCEQLAPGLREGRYSLIIGDDTSGRLPALTVRAFAVQLLQMEGKSPIPLVFLQASRKIDTPEVEKQVNERVINHPSVDPTSKILLVTDFVHAGQTIERLRQIFMDKGINFDVAIMTFANTTTAQNLRTALLRQGEVYIGEEVHWNAPDIYIRPDLTGLERATIKNTEMGIVRTGVSSLRSSSLVTPARKDISLLVSRLVNQLG